MPIDGSGNFTRSYNFVQDKANGIKIIASRMDGEFNNFASAINQGFLRTGIIPMTGSINMGANSIHSLSSGTVGTPPIRFNADATSGIYMPAAGQVGLVASGVERLQANSGGVLITGNLTGSTGTLLIGSALNVGGNAALTGLTQNQTGARTIGAPVVSDPLDPTRAFISFNNVAGASSSSSYISFVTNEYGVSSGERMRLDKSGNLGIGTSPSAAYRLDVRYDADDYRGARIYNASTGALAVAYLQFGNDLSATGSYLGFNSSSSSRPGGGNALALINGLSAPVVIGTGNAERLRVDGSGNLGIGVTIFGAGAAGVVGLVNATAPATSPAGMGQIYVEGGALKYRGSSGTVTVVAPA